ncbi:MAG: hypothetical protein JSU70_12700 [Phycisphaerales bacterium]|nr:MAG: hypothetical protein JSU70_12700 [Phycisphaerales bacterium]
MTTDRYGTCARGWSSKSVVTVALASVSLLICLLGGCANVRTTDPARTATEQFLLSEAAIKAVEPLSFEVLHGRRMFVDSAYFAPAEKEFVLAELRARLLRSGVHIVPDREQAEVILEVRSGGVGIDRYENLFGIPSLLTPASPADATGASRATIVVPELALTKNIKQIGFASVACIAYWADTGEVVANFGPSIGRVFREDWWLLGFGPRSTGTIPTVRHDVE